MWFILAGIMGIVCGMFLPYNVSPENLPYIAMAILAALDSIFGALLAYFNKKFNMSVFVLGLFSNAFLAVLLTYIGNLLGISLYFAVIIVFGVRLFNNMAAIRRLTIDAYFVRRTREKERKKRLALMAAYEADETEYEEESDNGQKIRVANIKKITVVKTGEDAFDNQEQTVVDVDEKK